MIYILLPLLDFRRYVEVEVGGKLRDLPGVKTPIKPPRMTDRHGGMGMDARAPRTDGQ